MMKKFGVNFSDFAESMEAGVSDFDVPTETMTTLTPLLYQSGYITIKDYEEAYDSYTLGIPNREVRLGLTKALISADQSQELSPAFCLVGPSYNQGRGEF